MGSEGSRDDVDELKAAHAQIDRLVDELYGLQQDIARSRCAVELLRAAQAERALSESRGEEFDEGAFRARWEAEQKRASQEAELKLSKQLDELFRRHG